jgi:hypothetical protein
VVVSNPLDRRLKIGTTLTVIAGTIVFLVATYFYVQFWIGYTHPSEPWRSGQFTPVTYTLADIEAFDSTVAKDFVLANHIEFANVMNSGFGIVVMTIFGLRRRQKWAWYAILATALWAGLNDAIALYQAQQPLVPLIGEAFILVGLFIARPAIFQEPAAA